MAKDALWQTLYDALKHDIATGVYGIGSHLPTELNLQSQFGYSRFTVRRALSQLEHDGLIERRARVGSVVIRSGAQSVHTVNFHALSDLMPSSPGEQFRFIQSSFITADRTLASALNVSTHSALFCFNFLSYAVGSGDTWPTVARFKYFIPTNGVYSGLADAIADRLQAHKSQSTPLPETTLESDFGITIFKTTSRFTPLAPTEQEIQEANIPTPSVLGLLRHFYDEDHDLIFVCQSRHYMGASMQWDSHLKS